MDHLTVFKAQFGYIVPLENHGLIKK